MPDPNRPGTMILTGHSSCILNLGAVSPLLLLARGIHRAKVLADRRSVVAGEATVTADDEKKEDENLHPEQTEYADTHKDVVDVHMSGVDDAELDSAGEINEKDEDNKEEGGDDDDDDDAEKTSSQKKALLVENPILRDYRNLFLAERDTFLRMLCVDMHTHAQKQNPPAHKTLFPHAHPSVAKPQALGNILITTSVRWRNVSTRLHDGRKYGKQVAGVLSHCLY